MDITEKEILQEAVETAMDWWNGLGDGERMEKIKQHYQMECEHEASSLERVSELDYSCEDYVSFLVYDVCQSCGKLLGKEIHTFKFSHRKDYSELVAETSKVIQDRLQNVKEGKVLSTNQLKKKIFGNKDDDKKEH